MPWYANGEPAEEVFAQNNRKVAPWPKSNGPRTDCRFRFNYGQYLPAPRPSQFFVRMRLDSGPDPITFNASVNLLAVSNTLLTGTTGVSVDGYEIVFELELFLFPNVDPHFGTSGIRYKAVLKNAGFPDLFFYQFVPRQEDGGPASVLLLFDKGFTALGLPGEFTNFDPLIFTYITIVIPSQIFAWWPISECISFAEPEEAGAILNGVDAWISFPADMPLSTAKFKVEFDIRPHESGVQMVVTGLQRFGSFATMLVGLDKLQWWNAVTNLSPGLVEGIFQKVRIEYNWSIPGAGYSVWIDDVLNGSSAAGYTVSPWDEIGRRGGTIEGKFDLKNFQEWGGNPAAPVLRIDLPLITDACPVIPLANKGTTFNMTLPSCP